MRIIYLVFFFVIISTSILAEGNKDKIFDKESLIFIGLTIANPAISLGTVITNTGTFKKILSVANITYTSMRGKSIAEEALSKTTKKNCLIKNLAMKKEFCS